MQLGFLLIPLAAMLLCLFCYYQISSGMLAKRSEYEVKHTLRLAQSAVRMKAEQIELAVHDLLAEDELYDAVYHKQKDKVRKLLNRHSELKERSSLIIYQEKTGPLYQENEEMLSSLLSESGRKVWQIQGENGMAVYTLRTKQGNDPLLLHIAFPIETFSAVLQEIVLSDRELLLLCDKDGSCLFDGMDKNIKTLDLQEKQPLIDAVRYKQEHESLSDTDWQLVVLAEESYLREDIHEFRNMLFFNVLLVFVMEMVLLLLIYHSIYDPMHRLVISMRDVKEDRLREGLVLDDGKDELHELSESFNALLLRTDELLHKVEQQQKQTRELQIQLLQAQIHPHFLFNTLTTLKYLALLNEDMPVSEGISALSHLLRNTIVEKQAYVSLEKEIENVKDYIVIQKLRYGNLFETEYNIEEAVKQRKILKFLLQPIVENSILHAFREDGEHQKLTIHAFEQADALIVEIGDNGTGFDPSIKKETNSSFSGIGMTNIKERLSLMYGASYGMEVMSEKGKGTIVSLRLPLDKGAEENV